MAPVIPAKHGTLVDAEKHTRVLKKEEICWVRLFTS